MHVSRAGTTRRRVLMAAAAVMLLALLPSPSLRGESQSPAPTEIRALWVLRTSLRTPASIATLVQTRAGQRLQHAARAGPRPRRRLLQRRPRTPRRRPAAPARDLRPAGNGARRRACLGAARARVGQSQPGLERRGSADCALAHHPPPSRVADGAAGYRARADTRQGRKPGVRRPPGALDAGAVEWRRRALRVADPARGGRHLEAVVTRPRRALCRRRCPPRLRTLSVRAVRLQPRRRTRSSAITSVRHCRAAVRQELDSRVAIDRLPIRIRCRPNGRRSALPG